MTILYAVTTGNTTNANSPTKFFAVPGYDLCTGWGTPAGSNLINALLASPDPLQITPVTNILFAGPAGGSFRVLIDGKPRGVITRQDLLTYLGG